MKKSLRRRKQKNRPTKRNKTTREKRARQPQNAIAVPLFYFSSDSSGASVLCGCTFTVISCVINSSALVTVMVRF